MKRIGFTRILLIAFCLIILFSGFAVAANIKISLKQWGCGALPGGTATVLISGWSVPALRTNLEVTASSSTGWLAEFSVPAGFYRVYVTPVTLLGFKSFDSGSYWITVEDGKVKQYQVCLIPSAQTYSFPFLCTGTTPSSSSLTPTYETVCQYNKSSAFSTNLYGYNATTCSGFVNNIWFYDGTYSYPKYYFPTSPQYYFCGNHRCTLEECNAACPRNTCSGLGKTCGSWSDSCGGTLNCGACPTSQVCTNGQCICTPTETAETSCSDGIDNDCDGFKDLNDINCQAEALCSDTIDNDGDSLIDCDDPDCALDASCIDCSIINCAGYDNTNQITCETGGCCTWDDFEKLCSPGSESLYCDYDGVRDVGLEECDPGNINDANPVPDFSGIPADYCASGSILVCDEYCKAKCEFVQCADIEACAGYSPDQCNLDSELCQINFAGCYLDEVSNCNECDDTMISCSSYLSPETCLFNPCALMVGDICTWDDTLGECIIDTSIQTAFIDDLTNQPVSCSWDCSGTSWSECSTEAGTRTRVGSCSPGADNSAGCEAYAPPASQKSCLIAKKFPFFSANGIIVVFVLLIGYYAFVSWKKKRK